MKAFITAICWNNICQFRISRAVFWSTGCRNTLSGILYQDAEWFMAIAEQRGDGATRQTSGGGTLRRIKRFANALTDGVPVRDKDRPRSDVDLLDWLRQCRRAGLYDQGKAIYEKGGLNLAKLTDEQQIEAEDDYRICVRRGVSQESQPKRPRRREQAAEE